MFHKSKGFIIFVITKTFTSMKMYTKACNDKREITTFINEKGIKKDDIITVFQDHDGLYVLMYYAEE